MLVGVVVGGGGGVVVSLSIPNKTHKDAASERSFLILLTWQLFVGRWVFVVGWLLLLCCCYVVVVVVGLLLLSASPTRLTRKPLARSPSLLFCLADLLVATWRVGGDVFTVICWMVLW